LFPSKRIRPIIPRTTTKLPDLSDPHWLFEIKYDGYRAILYINKDAAYFVSRSNRVMWEFQKLAESIRDELGVENAVLDGEIVALGPDGNYMDRYQIRSRSAHLVFLAFDVMWLNDISLLSQPLQARKEELTKLLKTTSRVHYVAGHVQERAVYLLNTVQIQGLEGSVAKHAKDLYDRRARWYKILNPNYGRQTKSPKLQ
jgi:bifunctional non-homologous end joining protein LigD